MVFKWEDFWNESSEADGERWEGHQILVADVTQNSATLLNSRVAPDNCW
jgi:hypothetical protein